MFKKSAEGEYSFSSRFWAQAIVLALLVIAIGWNSNRTYNNTEQLSRETIAYGKQTNDCLSQTLNALKNVRKVNDDISKLNDRRDQVTNNLIVGLASIPADVSQDEVQKQTAAVIEAYLRERQDVTNDSNELLRQRADVQQQYPDPTCGNKLPGE